MHLFFLRNMNEIEHSLGYRFKNISLLEQALTHSSISKDCNYEKLEFLGDSIISYFCTSWLIHNYPDDNESQLSIKKSQIVSKKQLSTISKSLELYKLMKINIKTSISERIHCDIFESTIGAVYIDSDIIKVCDILKEIFKREVVNLKKNYDYKGLLISLYNKREISNYNLSTTIYESDIIFISKFGYKGFIFYGFGNTKKNAEQRCSKITYQYIRSL